MVWERFGRVDNYVEPFFGSGACLLARSLAFDCTETVNDKDGLLANFWRALQADPDAVAEHADWPVNENDLHAKHSWLVGKKDSLQARLEGDPDYYDVKIAGWWVWGMACWIGGGFCSGNGPWHRVEVEPGIWEFHKLEDGDPGRGVNRQRPHLGPGQGVNRTRPHLGPGRGVNRQRQDLVAYFHALAARLRDVRVCCGDWSRVCSPSVTIPYGTTAIFLDPPYALEDGRDMNLYRMDCGQVAHDVREWAIEQGKHNLMRIALCSYDAIAMPKGWKCLRWKAHGGMANQSNNRGRDNAHRECVWFSPHCLVPNDSLFCDLLGHDEVVKE